jgi:hypothetical protein
MIGAGVFEASTKSLPAVMKCEASKWPLASRPTHNAIIIEHAISNTDFAVSADLTVVDDLVAKIISLPRLPAISGSLTWEL